MDVFIFKNRSRPISTSSLASANIPLPEITTIIASELGFVGEFTWTLPDSNIPPMIESHISYIQQNNKLLTDINHLNSKDETALVASWFRISILNVGHADMESLLVQNEDISIHFYTTSSCHIHNQATYALICFKSIPVFIRLLSELVEIREGEHRYSKKRFKFQILDPLYHLYKAYTLGKVKLTGNVHSKESGTIVLQVCIKIPNNSCSTSLQDVHHKILSDSEEITRQVMHYPFTSEMDKSEINILTMEILPEMYHIPESCRLLQPPTLLPTLLPYQVSNTLVHLYTEFK